MARRKARSMATLTPTYSVALVSFAPNISRHPTILDDLTQRQAIKHKGEHAEDRAADNA